MDSFFERVALNLVEQCGVRQGQRILLSVSGGADSTCLMYVVAQLQWKLSISCEVVHFNHNLRSAAADEALWVKAEAKKLGLSFSVFTNLDLAKLRSGVQEHARDWRRSVLEDVANRGGFDWIATGHQLDDQLELILLKLLRGCHLTHLEGMRWCSGKFIRPLLDFRCDEIRNYLSANNQSWVEDPSNNNLNYKRNRIRHQLLPLLNELSALSIDKRLLNLAQQAQDLQSLLESFPKPIQSRTEPHWISVQSLVGLPKIAQSEALYKFIQNNLPGEITAQAIEEIIEWLEGDKPVWIKLLPGRRQLRRAGMRLFLEADGFTPPEMSFFRVEGWKINADARFGLDFKRGKLSSGKGFRVYNLPENATLVVRRRKNGDVFHPPWRTSEVKLKDFLRDQHIPMWERDFLPCIEYNQKIIAIYPDFVGLGFHRPSMEIDYSCLIISEHSPPTNGA